MTRGSGLHVGIDARVLGRRGVGRYLSNLLRAMAGLGGDWRATVFLSGQSRAELVPRDPRFEAVRFGDAHPAWIEQVLIPREAQRRGVQVLHFPDNTGCVRPPMPMVLTLHDGMWRRPLKEALSHPTLRQRIQDAYRKWVCPRAARAAAAVITVSEFSAQELKSALSLKNVWVLPEGLDPQFEGRLSPARLRAELRGLGLSRPYVLCAGAADARKNIERLIRAFASIRALDQADLVVTSLAPGEKAGALYLETAARAGMAGRLRNTGYVTDPQMKALYQGALIYAFPSLWEGFGLPILEAYASGTPVLAARAGALPETAGQAAWLVDPLDERDIASGLSALLKRDRKREAAKGLKELARFSWDRTAAETLKIYAQAAGSGPA